MLAIRLREDAASSLQHIPTKHAAQIIARIKRYALDPQSLPVQKIQNYP